MTIEHVLRRARKKGAGTHWYEISARAAGKLVREAYGERHRAPRPGYVVDLPRTTYHGRSGRWMLSNRGGQYELMFHYE